MTLEQAKQKFPNYIVEEYMGYIVIDGYRAGIEGKKRRIRQGDTFGFSTVEKPIEFISMELSPEIKERVELIEKLRGELYMGIGIAQRFCDINDQECLASGRCTGDC